MPTMEKDKVVALATPTEKQHIDIQKIKSLLPKGTNVKVTEDMVHMINTMETDIGLPQNLMEEEVMSYMYLVGKIPGVGVKDLINAVKFCNLKRNMNNKQAWSIVFPAKYNELIREDKQVDNFVAMYNGSRMVVEIDKQMLIPVHIQYASYFHAAVNKQFKIMNGEGCMDNEGQIMTVTPMVAHLAAKELAVLTRQPEETKIDVKLSHSDAMLATQQEIAKSMNNMAKVQQEAFARGMSVEEIQKIHGGNVIDVELEHD